MPHEIKSEVDSEFRVAAYKHATAQLEAQSTELGREEWRAIIKQLRQQWAVWQGEDSLHEMAFGETE